MRGKAVEISRQMTADELRAASHSATCGQAAARMQAIANALEGMTRREAARLAGFERQALRDAILAYNAKGLDGLYDAPRTGRPCKLGQGQLPRAGRDHRQGTRHRGGGHLSLHARRSDTHRARAVRCLLSSRVDVEADQARGDVAPEMPSLASENRLGLARGLQKTLREF